ncbi:MAG: glycoside hydrolase domain-containing protein [Armatimonadota bacterium]|jgi:hypothetical protein
MKTRMTLAAITVALSALVSVATGATAPGEVLMFDFEGDAPLQGWETQPGAEVAVTERWASRGRQSVAITFHGWEPSPEADAQTPGALEDDIEGLTDAARAQSQNPAAVATREAGLLEPLDRFNALLDQPETSLLDRLEFDLHNPQDFPVTLRVGLREAERRLAPGALFTVEPHATRACSLVLGMPELRARLQDVQTPSNVVALALSMMLPDRDCTVYLDNVRLTVDLLSPATELAAAAGELSVRTAEMPGAVTAGLERDTARLAELAEALRRELADGRLDSWEEVRDRRERLAVLDGRFARLQPTFHRARIHARSAQLGDAPMVLATESAMRKVFLEQERFSAEFGVQPRLCAARNEYESFQAVIVPVGRDLGGVTWEIEPPRDAEGNELPVTVRVVGYVDTDQPRYTVPHTGWWPDPLLDFMTEIERIPADEVVPLWVTAQAPGDAAAGRYEGALTVRADNAPLQTLPFAVEVMDFEIPRRSSLRTLFSMSSLPGITPSLLYGDDSARMHEVYENWLLERYRIDPAFLYGANPPRWDAGRLRELLEKGLQTIRVIGISPRRGQPLPEDYWEGLFEERISRAEEYFTVLDEAGVSDHDVLLLTYLFDEWSDAQDGGLDVVHETARRISERWADRPEILSSSCAYDHTYGLGRPGGGAIDVWFPGMGTYESNLAHIARARGAGKQIWWYFAIGSFAPRPNWWVESPAIEARLIMGAMTAKFRPDGFMYYNIARWWEQPTGRWEAEHGRRGLITEGPRTRWHPNSIGRSPGSLANGDGSLLCPGPEGPLATIRLENIRDGLEDYEYYVLLRRLLEERGLPPAEGEVAPEVVEGVSSFTYDPAALEAERERLARRIIELSDAR